MIEMLLWTEILFYLILFLNEELTSGMRLMVDI